jgi:hypothetical protein
LLILQDNQRELPDHDWRAAERWLDVIESEAPAPLGVVLPMELPGPWGRRGELWGIELLRWLRWSGRDSVRLLPVLVVAWQSLEMILRRKHELLLVSAGTRFVRLPDVMDGQPSIVDLFAQHVRAEPLKWGASREQIDQLAGGSLGEAARLTHHDLANEGYSACRLWAGYVRALREAGGKRPGRELRRKIEWASGVRFSWQDQLERRQRQPAFQQFQIARRAAPPPQYPPIEDAVRIVREHGANGLPAALRILLVDDEFHKGLADALLKILFGDVEFTSRGPGNNEWVFTETRESGRWVRFVCVKNTTAASHWLKHWKEVDVGADLLAPFTYVDWLGGWATALGRKTSVEDVLSYSGANGEPALDLPTTPPVKPVTVILLDLRLNREQPETSYNPADLDSLVFRGIVKGQRPDLPVVILTASRQVLNHAVAMADAGSQDGWLTKEAPDVPLDDFNSARAIHYLLECLHLYATRGEWYGDHLDWTWQQIHEYSNFWNSPTRSERLRFIDERATEIFRNSRTGHYYKSEIGHQQQFWGFIQSKVGGEEMTVRLVARRVALACLLYTATWSGGEPSWNVKDFSNHVPHDPIYREENAVYAVVGFGRDLWIKTTSLKTQLLREEYEWLLNQEWEASCGQCLTYIREGREQVYPTARSGRISK